jgi:hypothetical protein
MRPKNEVEVWVVISFEAFFVDCRAFLGKIDGNESRNSQQLLLHSLISQIHKIPKLYAFSIQQD